ncbi:MAG: fibro-slime domain-containing protein [Deltaproteobacteria bacterium]|nr:fibro-slime domain-containing protein [Deltaproteobacteria bacterium]
MFLGSGCEADTVGAKVGTTVDSDSNDNTGGDSGEDTGEGTDNDSGGDSIGKNNDNDTDGLYSCTPGQPLELPVTVRDFKKTGDNTDFQSGVTSVGLELGVVKEQLGDDNKPVFDVQPNIYYSSFGGAENFTQWYNTDPDGVYNVEVAKTISLIDEGNSWVFDSTYFFPLGLDEGLGADDGDVTGWNDDETLRDQPQNFRFTTEFHMEFTYEAGQVFNFRGDDDVWVFINGLRVIDLGGIHGPEAAEVELDTLGLTEGEVYPMDIFHAERNPAGSNFRIETNISCFTPVAID